MELWQKAAINPFLLYAKSLEVVFVPNPKTQKQMESLPKMWNPFAVANMFSLPYEQQKESPRVGEGQNPNEAWQNLWSTYGFDFFKLYSELVQNMTDFWINYWKK